jgi:peptide/nickel transport system substrate-binding protein
MTSATTFRKRSFAVLGTTAIAALTLAGCSAGGGAKGGTAATSIAVGTTDKVTSLDPAGSYNNGSFAIMLQVYPFLMKSNPGTSEVSPDIAQSAKFTSPNEFTVVLKKGLTFDNGDKLTSSDVKFSFDRQLKIAAKNGPSSLLGNLESAEAVNDTTVVFHLKAADDQIWPQILSSPAAPIVDEQVFSADKVTSDDAIVRGKAFAGPYTISSYRFNQLVQFKSFPGYGGFLGKPKASTIDLNYYTDQSNLDQGLREGKIDAEARSLWATDIVEPEKDKSVTTTSPGG